MTVSETFDGAMAVIALSDRHVCVELPAISFKHEEFVMVDLAIRKFRMR